MENKEVETISLFERPEHKKTSQKCYVYSASHSPKRYCEHRGGTRPGEYDCNIDQYNSVSSYYEENGVKSRYMDYCYPKNINEEHSENDCSCGSNLLDQKMNTKKWNDAKPRYLDYIKNQDKSITRKRIRSPTESLNEEYIKSYSQYSNKKDNKETPGCHVIPNPNAPNQYYYQLDRRSRLCNYILEQSYPPSQFTEDGLNVGDKQSKDPPQNREISPQKQADSEKLPVKSRYMDYYYKNQEKQDSNSPDNNGSLEDAQLVECGDEDTLPKATVKARYMDYEQYQKQSNGNKREPSRISSQLDWKNYHRLYTIHKFLDDLQCNHPALCTTGIIGSSLEKRDLKVLKVSNSKFSNASVWIDGGIHAREWIAPAVNTYLIDYIVKNFQELPKSMKNKDWYFLPVMNPDGYELTHTNYRMWRKNKAWHGKECVGVDLNRNFSYGWGGPGSSDKPKSQFYRGPCPFSEPESSAVRDMLKGSGIDFKVYITLHSYGEVILFPFAFRDEVCPDYIRLLEGATVMSKAIYKATGNTYKVGISRDVMHGAAGTSCDWSYGEAKIPFCYLLELRSRKHKFRLPQEEIEVTAKEVLSCIMALMEFVDSYDGDGKLIGKTKMKRVLFKIPLFKIITVATQCIKPSQVWQVRFTDDGQKGFVRSLDTSGAINIWEEARSTMDFFVDTPRVAQVAAMLHERGIPFSVSIRDVGALKTCEQGSTITVNVSATAPPNRPVASLIQCCLPVKMGLAGDCMSWSTYHGLGTIYAFMDGLAENYPYLCHTYCIGKTYEGRELKVLKISNGNPDNQAVWMDGAIHAREWVSVAVVTYIANEIVKHFHKMPESVTNKDWYILPVMNPDGYVYTHTTDRMWRKNRAPYGQCVGVDLNRNFSYGWGERGEDGSSEDPGSIFFRGSAPFSEAETSAVKMAILEANVEFVAFLSFHSYGEVIIFPWGYTGDPCPSYVELLEGGTVLARAIHTMNGRTYKVGSTKDIMYYSAGTSTDWSYGVANIPYSYMIELPCRKHRFLLPKELILTTACETFPGVVELMNFIDRRSKGCSTSKL